MSKNFSLLGLILIVVYFYFSTFLSFSSKFWNYPFKEIKIKSFRDFKGVYKDSSNGLKSFIYLGNTITCVFGQFPSTTFIFVSKLKNNKRGTFLLEEIPFEYKTKILENKILNTAEQIDKQINTLKSLGAKRVILVPVPTKVSILNPDQLPFFTDHDETDKVYIKQLGSNSKQKRNPETQYNFFLKVIKEKNIETVNLFKTFKQYSKELEPIYLLEDSHWSDYGLKLTAKEIVNYLRPNTVLKVENTGEISVSKENSGGLYNSYIIPNWSFFRVDHSEYHKYKLIVNQEEKYNSNDQIILVGTSYSDMFNQELSKTLRNYSLNSKLINSIKAGESPQKGMENLLQNHKADIVGSTIIWEFPFRFTDRKHLF